MFGSLYTIPQGSNSTRWKMFVRFLLQMYEASFKPCKFSTSFPYITKSMNSSSSTTPFWFLRLFEKNGRLGKFKRSTPVTMISLNRKISKALYFWRVPWSLRRVSSFKNKKMKTHSPQIHINIWFHHGKKSNADFTIETVAFYPGS